VTDDVVVRPASAADRRDVLALLERALGWRHDARHEALFAWKHEHNVFGPSPAWVAWDGDRVVGFRTFLRWEFVRRGEPISAVRAVDTATDPQYQRRGVFRLLTLHALEQLGTDRAAFVFNTPNDQSRPGYVSMGWQVAGRIPLAARPTSMRGIFRMPGSRAPADLWSIQSTAGEAAASVLEDDKRISDLLGSQPRSRATVTRQSVAYLRWRYGLPYLNYRAVVLGGDVSSGIALFRVRMRGSAREAALCEVLVPDGDPGREQRLVRLVAHTAGADYLLRAAGRRDGCLPLPGQGPLLTWRPLRESQVDRRDWHLTLGDLELF
jgi:GNAT superfamily N-acetyltransferase